MPNPIYQATDSNGDVQYSVYLFGGTQNTQLESFLFQPWVARTTGITGTNIFQLALGAHHGAVVDIFSSARVVTAGTTLTTVDATYTERRIFSAYYTGSGTATLNSPLEYAHDTLPGGCAMGVSFTASGNTITFSAGIVGDNAVVLDWSVLFTVLGN